MVPSPLVVPKILCSLFASQNFDHYANSHSLYRPQGAVVFVAPFRFTKKRDNISTTFTLFNLYKHTLAEGEEDVDIYLYHYHLHYHCRYHYRYHYRHKFYALAYFLCHCIFIYATAFSLKLYYISIFAKPIIPVALGQ